VAPALTPGRGRGAARDRGASGGATRTRPGRIISFGDSPRGAAPQHACMDDARITPADRGHHDESASWTLKAIQDRPADPLEGWSPRRVAGLARRADRTRLRGPGALDALADFAVSRAA